ncbi:MAG: hypothetical protein U5O39_04775 [Gammaproteobacteria bacterium]|nr:hypothetical protein [Gammaproteobacteria bacterium]
MKHSIEIRELGPDDAAAYKALRVAAATDPAFGLDPEAEAACNRVGIIGPRPCARTMAATYWAPSMPKNSWPSLDTDAA